MDTSRHFFSAAAIERLLSRMVLLKLNVFHWHFADDQGWRLESLRFPQLHLVGGRRGSSLNGRRWQKHSGENIINFVLGVMGFAYAGLLATFLTALFTRRGRTWSVIAAMIVGFVVVLALQPNVWAWWTVQTGWTKAHLAGVKIASPWRLVLGVTAALSVCLIPRGNGKVVES